LDKPKKSKPKKTGKKKKRVNQGQLKKERERQRELELERAEKAKEPQKTIQSLGNAWKTEMIINQSKFVIGNLLLDVKKCSTCSCEFKGIAAYKEHIRSDWHKNNLSLKMKKMAVLTFEQFQEEQLMSDFIK
jgi:DNA polymerase II small subunit/DNA polymerase delta subunit B